MNAPIAVPKIDLNPPTTTMAIISKLRLRFQAEGSTNLKYET